MDKHSWMEDVVKFKTTVTKIGVYSVICFMIIIGSYYIVGGIVSLSLALLFNSYWYDLSMSFTDVQIVNYTPTLYPDLFCMDIIRPSIEMCLYSGAYVIFGTVMLLISGAIHVYFNGSICNACDW